MAETSNKVVREMLAWHPEVEMLGHVCGHPIHRAPTPPKRAKPMTHEQLMLESVMAGMIDQAEYLAGMNKKPLTHETMVYAVLAPGEWWTAAELREGVYVRFGEVVEAITAAIRRLRQRGVDVECERFAKRYRYRLVP